MNDDTLLLQSKLDIACKELSKALGNETACERYTKQSHVINRLEVEEPYKYKDIRGLDRYVR